jgi:hypothetical protein
MAWRGRLNASAQMDTPDTQPSSQAEPRPRIRLCILQPLPLNFYFLDYNQPGSCRNVDQCILGRVARAESTTALTETKAVPLVSIIHGVRLAICTRSLGVGCSPETRNCIRSQTLSRPLQEVFRKLARP